MRVLTALLAWAVLPGAAAPVSAQQAAGPRWHLEAAGPPFVLKCGDFTDLSGLTWVSGAEFAAVSDKATAVVPLTITLDPRTGAVTGVVPGMLRRVAAAISDFEGIAWLAAAECFAVAGEGGPGLQCFARRNGKAFPPLPLPQAFMNPRPNLSLESLTWDAGARLLWTANEEALPGDGEVSGRERGTRVRLQALTAEGRPVRQVAWETEPASMRFQGAGNGVAELCAPGDGSLLVLERGFGKGGLHARIFHADPTSAMDVSAAASLGAANVVPVRKTLLVDLTTGFTNYEALCAGPSLADGTRILVLAADSNGSSRHQFQALRLRPVGSTAAKKKPAP